VKIVKSLQFIICCMLVALAASVSASPSNVTTAYAALSSSDKKTVDELERRTFDYFRDSSSVANGLAADHWPKDGSGDYFASIAATGFALTAYGIGVERGWMPRAEAVKRTLATLRFFHDAPQSDAIDAAGNHGFFYHFLDVESGRRFGSKASIELSSLDTSELMAGVLFSMSYFDRKTKDEALIRQLADDVYRAVDWKWFAHGGDLLEGGWTPEHSYDRNFYRGYSEATTLYILAIGSPTHALDGESWSRWSETYDLTWGEFQGEEHLGGGPLFWHQYAQSWIDFRGIQDDYMRKRGIDYFTNSQRATLAQRQYAIHNPLNWKDYGANVWGLTACNGPKGAIPADGIDRYASDPKSFYGYIARGAGLNYTVDDGTIAPTAAVSSIAFTPEIVVPLIDELEKRYGDNVYTKYGFVDAFNPSFTFTDRPLRTGKIVPAIGWFDTLYIGIDQGPILSMLENFRSEFVWTVMKKNPYVADGLRRSKFTGGWLSTSQIH
jgi:hypothetical protein